MNNNHNLADENSLNERRNGLPTRRVGMPDSRDDGAERRQGLVDRRTATNDKNITIITCSGEYKGTINLNAAPLQVDRISDFFIKSDISFVTLYNSTVQGQKGKVTLVNIQDIAVIIPHDNLIPRVPELRQDVDVNIRMKFGIGQINGNINLMSETRPVDRVSDLLNYPGKKWIVLYEASFRGRSLGAVIINLDYISAVEG